MGLALLYGCGWGARGLERSPPPPAGDPWSDRVAVVRALCADLGLPQPGPIEVTPTPDDSAGVTFAAMIRLQPEDLDMRTATLMHEAGHLGVTRARDVEEAIADLTRRALLLHWLDIDPEAAAPVVPWLLQGLGQGVERAAASSGNEPAGLYGRATRLALALLLATPRQGSAPGDAAQRCAAAVRTARALTTVQVRGLADRLVPWRDVARARDEELTRTVLPALRAAEDRGHLESRSFLVALRRVLEGPDRPWHTLVGDRDPGSFQPASARVLFAILADHDREAARDHLEAWARDARRRADENGHSAALSRLAALHNAAGDRPRTDSAAMALLLEANDAASAAFGATLLHRRAHPVHEPLGQFLDLAPALRLRAPGTAAIRAHALAALGEPAAAAAEFSRAAAVDPSWSVVRGWAAALAAAGRPGRAAALLDADARSARERGDRARAGSSLLVAALLTDGGREGRARAAAALLDSGPASPDQALAIAADAAAVQGRRGAARRSWRRLLARAPTSDYAAEARAALDRSGQRQP